MPDQIDWPATPFGCVVRLAGRAETSVDPSKRTMPWLPAVRLSRAIPILPRALFPMSYSFYLIYRWMLVRLNLNRSKWLCFRGCAGLWWYLGLFLSRFRRRSAMARVLTIDVPNRRTGWIERLYTRGINTPLTVCYMCFHVASYAVGMT
jgi:hypothetical protein